MTRDDTGGGTRPDDVLEGSGADAFEAFNAMQATKDRHFALLERLDAKRERYGLEPTADERVRLAGLLADHDAQVARFTRAGGALKAADADAHRALFTYVGAITAIGSDDPDHGPTH